MDASSIITQVSREDEQLNNVPPTDKVESTSCSVEKKPRKNIFKSLFCCCYSKNESSTSRNNGNCIQDDDPSYGNMSFPSLVSPFILPPVSHRDMHKKCMVIDLDETLVHSSFKPISNADFIVPVEIEGTVHQVYVLKRPFVDEFLQKMGELYECILFTASLAKYADPVANLLDKWNVFRGRLFREHCVFHRGNYVKDLGKLGRELHKCIIMDNSPASYVFNPDNAVPVTSWFDDMSDSELIDLVPFLDTLSKVDNVYSVLRNCNNPLRSNNRMCPMIAGIDIGSRDMLPSSNGVAAQANSSPITQINQGPAASQCGQIAPREYIPVQLHQTNGSQHNNNNKEDSQDTELPPS